MADDTTIPDDAEHQPSGTNPQSGAPDDALSPTRGRPGDPSEPAGGHSDLAPAPPPSGSDPAQTADLLSAVGDHAATLAAFGAGAAQVLQVAVENMVGQAAVVRDVAARLTEYEAIRRRFEVIDHLSFELRVAISDTDAQLAAALLRADDARRLLGPELFASGADDTQAESGIETVARATRELLDLCSLALFDNSLAGAEVSLDDLGRGRVDQALGRVRDAAQGAPPAAIDLTLAFDDRRAARVTLVVPISLLSRVAGLLGADPPVGPTNEEPSNISRFPSAASGHGAGGAFEAGGTPRSGVGDNVPVHPARFPLLPPSAPHDRPLSPVDLIMDVSMRVSVELGRSALSVEEILELGPGSVVELNKLAGEPVDILINDRLIARGEVVVVDENFGVRVTEIISPRQRASLMRPR